MAKAKAKKAKVVHNWDRHSYDTPYEPGTMIEKAFRLALKGCKVLKIKELVLDMRKTKKGGNWVLTDLRNGKFNGATWTFTEKDGFCKITNLKMARTFNKPKAAKKARKAKPVAAVAEVAAAA